MIKFGSFFGFVYNVFCFWGVLISFVFVVFVRVYIRRDCRDKEDREVYGYLVRELLGFESTVVGDVGS